MTDTTELTALLEQATRGTLAARVLELEAENARLQKALEPFADAAETLIAIDYQGNESTTLVGDVALFGYHFKEARAALTSKGEG